MGDGWVKPGDGNWDIDHGMHLYSQLAGGAPVITHVTSCLDLHKALIVSCQSGNSAVSLISYINLILQVGHWKVYNYTQNVGGVAR